MNERIKFLENERFFLTPPVMEDCKKYSAWFQNQEFASLTGSYFRPISYAKNEKDFQEFLLSCDGTKHIFLSIISKKNGDYIGNVALDGIDLYERKCSFGIFIGDMKYRKQNYGFEVGKLILKYAFEVYGFKRINSSTNSNNTASIKLHKKLGFIQEGISRKERFINGEYVDLIRYGMLKEDYYV